VVATKAIAISSLHFFNIFMHTFPQNQRKMSHSSSCYSRHQ
jgi:hypothetical protein